MGNKMFSFLNAICIFFNGENLCVPLFYVACDLKTMQTDRKKIVRKEINCIFVCKEQMKKKNNRKTSCKFYLCLSEFFFFQVYDAQCAMTLHLVQHKTYVRVCVCGSENG